MPEKKASAPQPEGASVQQQEKKEKNYVVKIGALIVGRADKRAKGSTVKESELTKAEREFFVADGTIELAK